MLSMLAAYDYRSQSDENGEEFKKAMVECILNQVDVPSFPHQFRISNNRTMFATEI